MHIRTLVQSLTVPCLLVAALLALPANARAELKLHKCEVWEVMVHPNRVHVLCNIAAYYNYPQGYIYFAVPTSDEDVAARFTTVATAALSRTSDFYHIYPAGCLKHSAYQGIGCRSTMERLPEVKIYFYVQYDPNEDASWFGCLSHDCRRAQSFGLRIEEHPSESNWYIP